METLRGKPDSSLVSTKNMSLTSRRFAPPEHTRPTVYAIHAARQISSTRVLAHEARCQPDRGKTGSLAEARRPKVSVFLIGKFHSHVPNNRLCDPHIVWRFDLLRGS